MKSFDYNHHRAYQARLGKQLGHTGVKVFLFFASILCLACATITFLFTESSWYWFFASLSIFFVLLPYWIKNSLVKAPRAKDDSIVNLISAQLLGNIPKNVNADSLIQVALEDASSHFIGARYNLAPEAITILTSNSNLEVDQILAKALELKERLELCEINGATIAIAAIELIPFFEDGLAYLKLTRQDIENGLQWYNHLKSIVSDSRRHRNLGGIARDLDFGYSNLLQRLATNISETYGATNESTLINIESHREYIQQLADIFTRSGNQSVALIGDEGSGRETIVRAFATKILEADTDKNLRYRQIYKLDASTLLSVTNGRGQLEYLLNGIFGEAYTAKNIILWIDNAKLFFQEETGSVNLSNILTPVINAGNLRIIISMTKQQFLEISAKNPALASSINRINVEPTNEQDTLLIMQEQAPFIEAKNNSCIITYQALKEAYRLSSRYIHDLVMPGQAIALLDYAAAYPEANKFITERSVQLAIEQNFGVKMQSTQTDSDKDKLLKLEERLHERMIGQEGAVKAVSDALRRSAAGVRNQNRPIGTFLFLGPTGVGKTELAKALSQVYFNNEDDIVRVDLNEYVQESDVNRLIASGAENENSLCAQIAKKPFSVVLLDEIEKAHPKVLTTLLQLLDEGILRDNQNHEISFRDAIIICTSNAGADHIREYIAAGESLNSVKDKLSNELIHSGEFKPEFINRFDEVCVFEPLSKENLLRIVDLMLKGTNKNLEPQKITVSLDQEAKILLVDAGYDPKLGARPMRRIIQNTVENIVAKHLLAGEIYPGSEVKINTQDIKNQLGS